MATLLAIKELHVSFATADGEVRAVDGVSLVVQTGECLGVVGESGSGKTQLFLAVLGLLARNGRARGRAEFEGTDLLACPAAELNRVRGARVAMVLQDPMSSLTPHRRVGEQIAEVLTTHRRTTRDEAMKEARQLLERVHMSDAHARLRQYPHELSGGMCQRVMIAMALACAPRLIVLDEPTTALDVTIQAQLLALFRDLKRELNTAFVLITHDLGVIASLADRVVVMSAGRIVEEADVVQLFRAPRHPCSEALLRSTPRLDGPLTDWTAVGAR
jgi:ABC-type dipeptide/oligopeptide/nickel transport system ATPase component